MLAKYVLVLMIFWHFSASAEEGDRNEAEAWTCILTSDDITHYERWVDIGNDIRVRERRIEMTVNCSFERALKFLSQPQNTKKWMSGVSRVSSLDTIVAVKGDCQYAYTIMDLPWPLKDQDLVTRQERIDLSEDHSRIVIVSEDNLIPEKRKKKRIKDYQARWEITRLEANRVQIIFEVCCHMPPQVPRSLQDPVVKHIFRKDFATLKDLLAAIN
ncbi:SRPBCC family protein [Mangrovibacterium lignilyticum]|uniref:hypothetical protein n=1 Tax=Mangrovibacterium lignilyticum TaxID=2668052 RepID=UPI0013D1FA87|nr:hypothetical protein [Mangrovibacterium lignilyticum]